MSSGKAFWGCKMETAIKETFFFFFLTFSISAAVVFDYIWDMGIYKSTRLPWCAVYKVILARAHLLAHSHIQPHSHYCHHFQGKEMLCFMGHLSGSAGALYIDAMFVAISYLKQSSVQSTSKYRKGRKKMLMCLDYIKILRLTKRKGEKKVC